MGLSTSIIEFCRWLKAQWIAEVPDDLAICEFECRKSECSFECWATCVRRISLTLIGPSPGSATTTDLCSAGGPSLLPKASRPLK